jgi:multimeric flavodoxin WrbA
MNEILGKILAADVMVLASPVYFHSMNGQMKTFVDRVCPMYTRVRDKEVYFIISAAGGKEEVETTAQSLRVFTNCLHNIKEKGIISITGVWNAGGVHDTQAIKQAYAMGKNA